MVDLSDFCGDCSHPSCRPTAVDLYRRHIERCGRCDGQWHCPDGAALLYSARVRGGLAPAATTGGEGDSDA